MMIKVIYLMKLLNQVKNENAINVIACWKEV